jgi:hypothetical protein
MEIAGNVSLDSRQENNKLKIYFRGRFGQRNSFNRATLFFIEVSVSDFFLFSDWIMGVIRQFVLHFIFHENKNNIKTVH